MEALPKSKKGGKKHGRLQGGGRPNAFFRNVAGGDGGTEFVLLGGAISSRGSTVQLTVNEGRSKKEARGLSTLDQQKKGDAALSRKKFGSTLKHPVPRGANRQGRQEMKNGGTTRERDNQAFKRSGQDRKPKKKKKGRHRNRL